MHLLTRVELTWNQASAQAVWGGKCLFPFCLLLTSRALSLLRTGACNRLKGCGLLANSQSCQPLATWGSALIEQDLFDLYNRTKTVLLPVIWQSSPKAVSSCSPEQGETCFELAGLRNKACRFAGVHVVSNGRFSQ